MADDRIPLPLVWRAWIHLPLTGSALPERLVWPEDGQAIVELEPTALLDETVSFVLAEVASDAQLFELCERLEAFDATGVLLTGAAVTARAEEEVQGRLRSMALHRLGPAPSSGLPEASRSVAELVRRRAYLVLLAHWRRALAAHEASLLGLLGSVPPASAPARPTMAPLSTILDAHVAGVLGLWWPGVPKAAEHLGVSAPTLRRARGRVPDALRASLGSLAAREKLTLLVVEDEPLLAKATGRALALHAEKLGRSVATTVAPSAEAARRHVLESGAPDVVWADIHLETPEAGIDFVAWLRKRGAASVVLGKTGAAGLAGVRRMTQLGALSVWAGHEPRQLRQFLADGLRAADEAQEIVRLEAAANTVAETLRERFSSCLAAADALRALGETRQLVEGLETDLATAFPSEAGDASLTLEALEIAIARQVMGETKSLHEAARVLGTDRKRLRRLLAEP